LLEDLAIAIVPHGSFLLEHLLPDARRKAPAGKLLALGGVDYDQSPEAVIEEAVARRAPAVGAKQLVWGPLPASGREMQHVLDLAGKANKPVLPARTGRAASVAQLLQDLPQARWLHLATHGFLADEEFRSALQFDAAQFQGGIRGERSAAGVRNPLALSGLVLAGANRAADEADHGILTAEALVGLPLENLELAVLSACETGLGDVAGGEGVFGLQRAFHLAGAHNVVASLWHVEDEATAALMGLFYRKLWIEQKPPMQALREAQLYLYQHPEEISVLAQKRGVDFANPQTLPKEVVQPPPPSSDVKPGKRAKTGQWAAFVLSGLGR
jgi:CHAT domain-containing protein